MSGIHGDTCAFCHRIIHTPKAGKMYCGVKCASRARREKFTDSQEAGRGTVTASDLNRIVPCYYCGLPADTVDHALPQSIAGFAASFDRSALPPNITVPACVECNSAIGARLFRTLTERKAWLKKWLRRRYRQYLDAPAWTTGELRELDGRMRQHIEAMQDASITAWRRVRW